MILAFIMGILGSGILYLTTKYYLPVLSKRAQKELPEVLDNSSMVLMENKKAKHQNIGILIGGFLFSFLFGYFLERNAVSIFSIVTLGSGFLVLACVFVTDLKLYIIPNLVVGITMVIRIVILALEAMFEQEYIISSLVDSVLGLIISFLFLLAMSAITKQGLGYGDVKIFSAIGFLCGIQTVFYTLFFSFLLCAIVSTGFLMTKKKKFKDSLPLGPFIWFGYGISIILALV